MREWKKGISLKKLRGKSVVGTCGGDISWGPASWRSYVPRYEHAMLGKRNRNKKEIERPRMVLGGQSSEY